jgi:hypothetical protein
LDQGGHVFELSCLLPRPLKEEYRQVLV